MMEENDLHQLAKLKGISFAHLNIRSLFGKLEDIIHILNKGDICLLGISETWLNQAVPSTMLNIPHYDIYRSDRTANSGKQTGGGVCMYVHTKYNVVPREDLYVCNPDIEVMWMRLSLKDTRPTYIACIYWPPEGNIDNAIDILEGHVLELSTNGIADYVLMGDYNINSMKPRSTEYRKLSDFCKRLSLTSLIKTPTFYRNNVRSFIDDILISNPDYYHQSGTVATGDTDHVLIYTTRKKLKQQTETCYIYGRTYRKFDPVLFQRDCIFANWEVMGDKHI